MVPCNRIHLDLGLMDIKDMIHTHSRKDSSRSANENTSRIAETMALISRMQTANKPASNNNNAEF